MNRWRLLSDFKIWKIHSFFNLFRRLILFQCVLCHWHIGFQRRDQESPSYQYQPERNSCFEETRSIRYWRIFANNCWSSQETTQGRGSCQDGVAGQANDKAVLLREVTMCLQLLGARREWAIKVLGNWSLLQDNEPKKSTEPWLCTFPIFLFDNNFHWEYFVVTTGTDNLRLPRPFQDARWFEKETWKGNPCF